MDLESVQLELVNLYGEKKMFSIIIPNYNNEKYLDELFESIKNQTFKNYEIIFIDDVSEDNSIQKAKEWKGGKTDMRVGMGYDVHKLVEDRDLILGGVKIPHALGLLGHSDADVLVHAIMDALLGAAALGDIGKHFPDTDPAYKGVSSIKLLAQVGTLVEQEHYVIENIDATVIAQKPKLRPYIEQMQEQVAEVLHLQKNQINIKATTEEGLGFTGTEEGIAAQAICCISSIYENSVAVGGSDFGCTGCGGCGQK